MDILFVCVLWIHCYESCDFRCFLKVIGIVQIARVNTVKLKLVLELKVNFLHAAFVRKNVMFAICLWSDHMLVSLIIVILMFIGWTKFKTCCCCRSWIMQPGDEWEACWSHWSKPVILWPEVSRGTKSSLSYSELMDFNLICIQKIMQLLLFLFLS